MPARYQASHVISAARMHRGTEAQRRRTDGLQRLGWVPCSAGQSPRAAQSAGEQRVQEKQGEGGTWLLLATCYRCWQVCQLTFINPSDPRPPPPPATSNSAHLRQRCVPANSGGAYKEHAVAIHGACSSSRRDPGKLHCAWLLSALHGTAGQLAAPASGTGTRLFQWQQSSSCRLCSPLMTSSPAALATGTGSPAQEAGSGSEAGTLPHHCFQTYQQGGHAIYRMQSFPPVC